MLLEFGRLTFAALVSDNEGSGDGLVDPDGGPTASRDDSNPEPELPAPNPARIVREVEVAKGHHRRPPTTLPEGGDVVSCQQRPLPLSRRQDTVPELLLSPRTSAIPVVMREISIEDNDLKPDRKRDGRQRDGRGGSRVDFWVSEEDLDRRTIFEDDPVHGEDWEFEGFGEGKAERDTDRHRLRRPDSEGWRPSQVAAAGRDC